ncbi:MAG: bifunctional demethylmenaquinone methyltransferase/2-methoxy-6-polyprenyl-1,4-benzoquinol methylase UbiE [Candidatus Hydrogenedentes bacterium]|nr:bifunctional demethylmenaquinone methyltransferase/2-methoxy-6-polyprenyl-1,4-benzoquinol methylase UbiE [Candidatus Hydrogenedentota bacterium]
MFDRIAHRYDLLNHLLSFRRDVAWRRHVVRHLPTSTNLRVLDLATGTGDLLLDLCQVKRVSKGIGVDMAGKMLAFARRKIVGTGFVRSTSLIRGDALRLGFLDNSFDAVTIAFGIRNVARVDAALEEMYRVLRPGGRALILEFSLPPSGLFQKLYRFYLRHLLPRIGAMISGDGAAYRYLHETIECFPYGEAFCDLMRRQGFQRVQAQPLTLGIATLYCGDK